MSVSVAHEFHGRWQCFWATTYEFDPVLFDEYLFRRLGDPPLNATVLADFRKLAELFGEPEAAPGARRANRDYLLRGVPLAGAFHPKTYLFGNEQGGVLLVGSGNLTLPGIEEGHEVFARFDSQKLEELEALRGWRDWMERIVAQLADGEVRHRWLDLRGRLPWLDGTAGPSPLVTNLDRPLIDALCDGVRAPVDALHILAPYYDRDGEALAIIVQRLRPRSLHLYLGARTSVDGPALAQKIRTSKVPARVFSFEPKEFVHAKLVGIVAGRRGRLLSGSANLSRAALTASRLSEPWSNVEVGVILDAPAEEVVDVFRSSGLEPMPSSLDAVAHLRFDPREPPPAPSLRLRAARLLDGGRVEVEFEGAAGGALFVTAGVKPERVVSGRSAGALMLPEGAGLVWLCEGDGAPLSNRVPLDEPARLRSWLEEQRAANERPRELDATDMATPIGRMLQHLNETFIFDIDDTHAAAHARASGDDYTSQGQEWDFLEELLREELRYDSRLERYRSSAGPEGLLPDDDVLLLLRAMLERAPAHWTLKAVDDEATAESGPGTGRLWSPERRLQVRLFNVLERWCEALNDPRLVWIDPTAPARNYAALLVALAECWEQRYLREGRVIELLATLFTTFITGERSAGFLTTLEPADRARVLARIPDEARFLAAGLAYAALRPGVWAEHIFEWQPFIAAARGLDVILVGAPSVDMVRRLTTETVTWEVIDQRLEWAGQFTDDEHWVHRQQNDLGLESVELVANAGYAKDYGAVLKVKGASLETASLVPLVRRALAYRSTSGAVIRLEGAVTLSVRLGNAAYAVVEGRDLESREMITDELLAAMDRSGAAWAHVLEAAGAVAS